MIRTVERDDGAAAVEFALVVSLLILLLVAIVDYGLWFSDSVGLRHGAREGARAGVVGEYAGCAGGDAAAKTACVTKDRVAALGGNVATRVNVSGGTWEQGRQLTVCATVEESGLTNLAPLPADGILRSEVKMRVEVTRADTSSSEDEDPSGDDWSWCG